jgi:ribosomal protein S27E
VPTGSPLAVVACPRCRRELGLSRWDRWNGFFVSCPECGQVLGKPWNLRALVIASLVLNALSFFLTMRPRTAAPAVFAQAAFIFGGAWLVTQFEDVDAVMVSYVLILMLLPLVVNLFLFMNHERVLQHGG